MMKIPTIILCLKFSLNILKYVEMIGGSFFFIHCLETPKAAAKEGNNVIIGIQVIRKRMFNSVK